MPPKCLIVEIDNAWVEILTAVVSSLGLRPVHVTRPSDAVQEITHGAYALVTLDISLDAGKQFSWGKDILAQLALSGARVPPIVLVTGTENIDDAVACINQYSSLVCYFARKTQWNAAGFRTAISRSLQRTTSMQHALGAATTLIAGQTYEFAWLKVDAVDHSRLSRRATGVQVTTTFERLRSYIQRTAAAYGGEEFCYEGDGGLYAFSGDPSKPERAVKCAVAIKGGLESFNVEDNCLREPIRLRFATHVGPAMYRDDAGIMQSDAINLVAHLEKKLTGPNSITITAAVKRELPRSIRRLFVASGKSLYGQRVFTYRSP
jgi:class 3 adenylate cyclase